MGLLVTVEGRCSYTRHRNYRDEEIKPGFLAFNKEIFQKMAHIMKLPPSYLYMRVNAGASGNFAKYSTFDDEGAITHLSEFAFCFVSSDETLMSHRFRNPCPPLSSRNSESHLVTRCIMGCQDR